MLFTGHFFLFFFFPIFITLYLLAYKKSLFLSNLVIVIASLLFYLSFGIFNILVLIFPMLFDYYLAILIYKTKKSSTKKILLTAGIVFNLILLGYFKYTNFLISDVISIFGFNYSTVSIILPVGISFIVFQRIAYLTDIFRKGMKPCFSFINYSTYATIFPHLISGPIVRYSQIKDQLSKRTINSFVIFEGTKYFVFGLFLKVMIADKLFGLESVLLEVLEQATSLDLILLVFTFSLRIYLDFTGYSLIAIGLAKMLGFDFPKNFNSPYLANSFQDFWRRWNITLSSWLRDYLYISLGGNRHGKISTYRNLLVTMLLGGLWHGASWNFVLWGFLHGSYLALERYLSSLHITFPRFGFLAAPFVFLVVSLTWITFLFKDIGDVIFVFVKIFSFDGLFLSQSVQSQFVDLSIIIYLALLWTFKIGENSLEKIKPSAAWSIVLAVTLVFLFAVTLDVNMVPFIYFQF